MAEIEDFFIDLEQSSGRPKQGRPWVTLSYAQSLDGCISQERGRPTPLSGPESLRVTHRLRAAHDAILVGIGTVLSDNPRLTVRLVEGPQPQPVVLDPSLRMPSEALLLQNPACLPWIAAARNRADPDRAAALERLGAQVLWQEVDERGWIRLPGLLGQLRERGVRTLMVEGGARVITSFLAAGLVDRVMITIAPVVLGGLRAVEIDKAQHPLVVLDHPGSTQVGMDEIVWGRVSREAQRADLS